MKTITLPIYYTIKYKTKKDKTILVGMNFYRNAHHFTLNEIKKHYHELIEKQIGKSDLQLEKYMISYKVYLKNPSSDGPNVRACIEKFALDGLIKCGVLKDDCVKYMVGDSAIYLQDKENHRCEIIINKL